jgi:cation/acetate symporter
MTDDLQPHSEFLLYTTEDGKRWGISPEGIGSVGMLLNFISAYVVSKLTAAPPDRIQQLVEDIRVPKGAGGAVAH